MRYSVDVAPLESDSIDYLYNNNNNFLWGWKRDSWVSSFHSYSKGRERGGNWEEDEACDRETVRRTLNWHSIIEQIYLRFSNFCFFLSLPLPLFSAIAKHNEIEIARSVGCQRVDWRLDLNLPSLIELNWTSHCLRAPITMPAKIVATYKKEFKASNCGLDHDPVESMVRSQWQSRSKSHYYLAYRIAVAIFTTAVVIVSLHSHLQHYSLSLFFIYLTHWGIIINMVVGIFGAALVSIWHFHPEYAGELTRHDRHIDSHTHTHDTVINIFKVNI